ncbi:MAG: transcriptional regulator [Gloeobacterales cyanobacterium]
MTLTFNPDTYGSLLAQYRPKVITSELENNRAIAIAEELEHRSTRTPEEEALLELLVTLIEKFEEEHYPIPESSPLEILLHLMEVRDCKQEDLIGVIGSRGVTSEVVNGKRSISKTQAKALADFFKIDASLFI